MIDQFRVLDLFSGIGGFSLGLERAGMKTVAFCEQDGYARRVLKKHWPDVWLYEDVRTLTAKRLRKDGLNPNVICGGFPCQDISTAGKGAGISGERSGLWKEMLRLIKEVKPVWVIAENVPALRSRGADEVLADLEGAGYAAWPTVVGAVNVGAKHRRERVWLVAYSNSNRVHLSEEDAPSIQATCKRSSHGADAQGARFDRRLPRQSIASLSCNFGGRFKAQPQIRGIAHGVPARVDRLRCLGNAVVPLIPELIGRAIIRHGSEVA